MTAATPAGPRFVCSWSGGKDSCLALYHAMRGGHRPALLFTMMTETGERSRSHGLPRSLLETQAQRLGVPIVFASASWPRYESVFIAALSEIARDGVEAAVFGDIDVDRNRAWAENAARSAGLAPLHPLWQRPRRELLHEFIDLGFRAIIVVTRDDRLAPDFLGRTIDRAAIAAMEQAGIDASGEMGEYHTVVTGGPIFSADIRLHVHGQRCLDGYSSLVIAE